MATTFIPLTQLRAHYARMAAQSRANADRAADKGLHDLAAVDLLTAQRAQDKANAITVALRAQHMARAA